MNNLIAAFAVCFFVTQAHANSETVLKCTAQSDQKQMKAGESFSLIKNEGLYVIQNTDLTGAEMGRVRIFPDFLVQTRNALGNIVKINIDQSHRQTFGRGNRVKIDLEFSEQQNGSLPVSASKSSLKIRVVENSQVAVYSMYSLSGQMDTGGEVKQDLLCTLLARL